MSRRHPASLRLAIFMFIQFVILVAFGRAQLSSLDRILGQVVAIVGAQVEILKDLTHLENNLGALEQEATLDDTQTAQLQTARIRHVELLARLRVVDYRFYT
ncbi:hypothetical protein NDU88_002121 [Pleurodeles waltl]|uniref:Uncharacterized protein n=1 Tax=Pleurodeles waltl TaxID=8319 RepID=A0AAV7LF71_PLEWA|nr:hypothetical protein NDU88_002121 [Pleurodeles waltl]